MSTTIAYPHITVTSGMSGYFAVKIWWNPQMGGFPEPWSTGAGRYPTEAEAVDEAKTWAASEAIPFIQ